MRFGKRTDFDRNFLMENMMGPNCVRLAAEILQKVSLKPDMRVLDLGCGKGLTSIFLAREFDVQVFATDLWIEATENYGRFKDLGLEEEIIPLHADARALPFAHGYFDAVVSIDSYHYFGNTPDYLDTHLVPLLKRGGTIAVSIPGLIRDFTDGVPAVLKPFWEKWEKELQGEMNIYTAEWWTRLWGRSSNITLEECFSHTCHKQAWEEWLECDNPYAKEDIEMMKAENGQYFNTIGLVARKN